MFFDSKKKKKKPYNGDYTNETKCVSSPKLED